MGGDAGVVDGPSKVLAKLEKQIAAGNFYEAQQMYMTVFHRSKARKKLADALHLLRAGACTQLAHGQLNCGEELAVLLAETYLKDAVPVDATSVARIEAVLGAFADAHKKGVEGGVDEAGLPPAVASAVRFMGGALKWSKKVAGKGGRTSPALHDMLAGFLWTALGPQGLGVCTPHFIRGSHEEGPKRLAAVLQECARQGLPEEEELFVGRAMLQYLAVGDEGGGEALADAYRALPGGGKVLEAPLVNCARFLARSVGKESLPLFRKVRESYRPVLSRDPCLGMYLDRAEAVYFNAGGGGGMLGDLMSMLMGGDEGED